MRYPHCHCTVVGAGCRQYTGPWAFDPEPFHTFVVRRHSETELRVWVEVDGRRSNVATLPLTADRDRLFVSSFVGPTQFVAEGGQDSGRTGTG